MTSYYQEIIADIQNLIQQKAYQDAHFWVQKELSMPYIPYDVEQTLIALKKELSYHLQQESSQTFSIDKIMRMLKGSDKSQLVACEALKNYNLRLYVEQIQSYFLQEPCQQAVALLIDTLAQQEIGETFVYRKNGVEYEFIPEYITPIFECLPLQSILEQLESYYSKNPSLFQIAKQIAIYKAYMLLPLNIEQEDIEEFIKQVSLEVEEVLHRDVNDLN